MSDNWKHVKQEVDAHRNSIKKMSPAAAEEAKYSFLLTKKEIDRVLALKGPGTSLDGLRIFLGAKEIDNHLVHTIHVVAVENQGGHYADYNVPTSLSETDAEQENTEPAGGGSTCGTVPCPPTCNGGNILNR